MEIKTALEASDIRKCWKAIFALRPFLHEETFIETIQRLQKGGYNLVYIEEDGEAAAVGGFELGEKLHRGKYLYVDDLSTLPQYRKKGYGGKLLEWIIEFARKKGCDQVHLDSGVQRFDAHRFYLKKGFHISSHHFAMIIKAE